MIHCQVTFGIPQLVKGLSLGLSLSLSLLLCRTLLPLLDCLSLLVIYFVLVHWPLHEHHVVGNHTQAHNCEEEHEDDISQVTFGSLAFQVMLRTILLHVVFLGRMLILILILIVVPSDVDVLPSMK